MNQFRPILRGVAALAGVDVQEIPDHFFRSVRDLATTRLSWAWDAAQFPETVETVEVDFVSSLAEVPTGYQSVIEVLDANPDETTAGNSLPFVRTGDNIRCLKAGTSTCWLRLKKTAPVLEGDVYDADETYAVGDQVYHLGSFWTRITAPAGALTVSGTFTEAANVYAVDANGISVAPVILTTDATGAITYQADSVPVATVSFTVILSNGELYTTAVSPLTVDIGDDFEVTFTARTYTNASPGTPGTSGALWTEVEIPARLNAYTKFGVYADILRTREVMQDLITDAEGVADGAIDFELTKHFNHEGQLPKTRILTR